MNADRQLMLSTKFICTVLEVLAGRIGSNNRRMIDSEEVWSKLGQDLSSEDLKDLRSLSSGSDDSAKVAS